jgi:hypothetical protein
MRSFGPRVDPETGALHARVSQAHDYTRVTTLWRRTVGNGSIECKMYRAASGPARRIIQLHAEYTDAGVHTTTVCGVADPLDEQRQAARLERVIRAASARPDPTAAPPEAPSPAAPETPG